MPIEYQVSSNRLRIDTYPRGVVDIDEAINYFSRLKQDDRIAPGAEEVVYFRDVTDFKISFLEGQQLVDSFQQPQALKMIKSTTFVCESDLAYGIARMLQIFVEMMRPEYTVNVTRSDIERSEG